MRGVEILHVVFDISGSFHEPGKQHMLNYLGNTAMNFSFASWAKAEFVFHTWNEELEVVEEVSELSTRGIADAEILRQFLTELTETEAVILITDGAFEGVNKRSLKSAISALGQRFAAVAAGYDAEIAYLQSLTPNFFFAEDMYTAFKFLAG